jgi:hypothetical protein
MDVSRAEAVQDDWKSAGGSGGLDPVVGGVLGEMEDVGAVGKERRESFAQVETPFIQDCQMSDESGSG